MSYAFDVMARVFEAHIRKHIDPRIAVEFEGLIQEMHLANHKVPSADGVFKGDGINKDAGVSLQARELDEAAAATRNVDSLLRQRVAQAQATRDAAQAESTRNVERRREAERLLDTLLLDCLSPVGDDGPAFVQCRHCDGQALVSGDQIVHETWCIPGQILEMRRARGNSPRTD